MRRLQLHLFGIRKRQKTWFLTAPCCVCLAILLVLAAPPQSLPTVGGRLALAAPSLSPDPTVRIEPAEKVVGAGQISTVSVMIDQADDLGGFEFTLLFTPAAVTVDSVTVGDFPGSTGRDVIPAVGPVIDNQAGEITLGVVTVGGASGPSGTGTLATVAFTAQGRGESALDLQRVMVVDTQAGHETPAVEDGVVRVGFAVYLPLILKVW